MNIIYHLYTFNNDIKEIRIENIELDYNYTFQYVNK